MDSAQIPPGRILAQMLVGNQVQQAIYVATKLGIADLLADGPKRIEDLAQATRADPGALYRLLRALASFGIFVENEPFCFELTSTAALLQSGIPGSMRTFSLWTGDVSYQVFGDLEYSVRTGKPAFEHLFGMEFFEYLAQNPETGKLFDEMMSWSTAQIAPEFAAYDLSGVNKIVDVGGGRGDLLVSILHAHPEMSGMLIDHPRVIQYTKRRVETEGLANRCEVISGDFTKFLPKGGDAYLLKSVVHGLDDGAAVRLLKSCCEARNGGAKLLLIEFVMPPGNGRFPGKLMDLLMLAGCYGRERSEQEFRSLFAEAGLRLTKIVTTRSAYSIIEGEPA